MKNFNFFDKLFEQCRTLRRVGMVLVMCLTVCGNAWGTDYTPGVCHTVSSTEILYGKDYTAATSDANIATSWVVLPDYSSQSATYSNVTSDSNGNSKSITDNITSAASSSNLPKLASTNDHGYTNKKRIMHIRVKGITSVIIHGYAGSTGRGMNISVNDYSSLPATPSASNTTVVTRSSNGGSFIDQVTGLTSSTDYVITLWGYGGDVAVYAVELIAPASSARTYDGTEKMYFLRDALTGWAGSDPDFFACFWNSSDVSTKVWSAKATYIRRTTDNTKDIWAYTVPSGTWDKVIITRHPKNTSTPSFENKWTQSDDITIDATCNFLTDWTVSDSWDDGGHSITWKNITLDGKKVYFDRRNYDATWTTAYVRLGHGSSNSVWGAMTKVGGTKYLYQTETDDWDYQTYFSIANNRGWSGSNNIYQPYENQWTGTGNEYQMSMQTNYQNYGVDRDAYICPTGTSTSERNCQYYQVNGSTSTTTFDNSNQLKALPAYTITTSLTHCSVTMVKYTADDFSTSESLSSGGTVKPTQYIGVTVTPDAGYKFSSVSLSTDKFEQHTAAAAGVTGKYAIMADECEVTAVCVEDTYTITYKDGGDVAFSGVLGDGSPEEHTYGTPTPLVDPTRDGYSFGGWYTNSNFTGSKVTTLTADGYTANITLYAQWTKNVYLEMGDGWDSNSPWFAVYYYKDEVGSGWARMTLADECSDPAVYTAQLPMAVYDHLIFVRMDPSKDALSWDSKWTQTEDIIYPSTNFKYTITDIDGGADGKSTGSWGSYSTPTFTISYNAGTNGSGSKASEAKTCNVDFTLPSSAVFTRSGYTQTGWTTSDGGSQTHELGGSYTTDAAQTFYPVWTEQSYSITYKDGGNTEFSGTHADGHPTSHTYGSATALKKATKTGYAFAGWYTASGCTGDAVTSLGATAYTANITLYARWVELDLHEPGVYEAPTSEGGYGRVLKHATVNAEEHDYEVYLFTIENSKGSIYAGPKTSISDGKAMFTEVATNTEAQPSDTWFSFRANTYEGSEATVGVGEFSQLTSTTAIGDSRYAMFKASSYLRLRVSGYSEFAFIGRDNSIADSKLFRVRIDGVTQDYTHNVTDKTVFRFDLGDTGEHFIEITTTTDNSNRFRGFSLQLPDVTRYTVSAARNNDSYGSLSASSVANVRTGSTLYVDDNTFTVNGTTVTATPESSCSFVNWTVGGSTPPSTVTGNITMMANFSQSFSVTYNKNGATDGTAPSDATEYESGDKVTVKDTTGCNFVYSGYVFRGWNTENDGSGDFYAPGDKFEISSNTTLYAVWVAGTAGTVTYNLTLNSINTSLDNCASATPTSGDLTASTDITTYGTAGAASSQGNSGKENETQKLKIDATYTAANYYEWTCAIASGKTFTPSQVEMKFQAVSDLTQYKIVLTDGTTSYDSAFVQTTSTGNTLETLTWNIAEGDAFAASSTMRLKLWAFKKNDGATAFRLGSPITIKGVVGTAAAADYTLTWDLAGGTVTTAGTGAAVDATGTPSSPVAYGSPITAPVVAKDGYSFAGWDVTPASTMPATDVTYTAQWSLSYSITYDCDGADSGCPSDVASATNLPNPLPSAPLKSGYVFDGWYTNSGKTDAAVAGATLTANATLYAKWVALSSIPCLDLTELVDDDDYWSGDKIYDGAYYDFTQVGATGNTGWELDVPESGDANLLHIGAIGAIKEVKLTIASIEEGNTGINYYFGTTPIDDYDAGEYTATGSLSTGALSLRPTSGDYNAIVFKPTGANIKISEVCIYYEPAYFTVTYNANGDGAGNATGTTGSVPTDASRYAEGETVTVLGKNTLAKSDYGFAGWRTAAASGTWYVQGETFDMGTSNVTLYAQWVEEASLTAGTLYKAGDMKASAATSTGQYKAGISTNGIFEILGSGVVDGTGGPMEYGSISSQTIDGTSFNAALHFKGTGTGTPSGSTLPTSRAIKFRVGEAGTLHLWVRQASKINIVKDGGTASAVGEGTDYRHVTVEVSSGTYYMYSTGSSVSLLGMQLEVCSAPDAPTISGTTTYTTGETMELTATCEDGVDDETTYTWYKGATFADAEEVQSAKTEDEGGTTYSKTFAVADAGTYWCKASNGIGCNANNSVGYSVSAQSYTVTYAYNGATGGNGTASSMAAEIMLPTPTKTGNTFDGWYVGATKIGVGGGTYYPTADVTAYAKWKENCTSESTVSIFNGETDSAKPTKSDTYDKSYDNDETDDYYVDGTTGFKYKCTGLKDAIVDISTYTDHGSYSNAVQMNGSGASNYIELVVPTNYTASLSLSYCGGSSNQQFGLNTSAITPNGSNCSTWNATASASTTVYSATVSNIAAGTYYLAGSGSSCYFAKIAVTVTSTSGGCYYVTYHGNGATSGYVNDPIAYEEDDDPRVLSNGFTRTGYEFVGWNTEDDGSGTPYAEGATITDIDDDVTLYAQWRVLIDANNANFADYTSVGSTDDVRVANGATLTITANKTIHDLIIEPGATLSITSGAALSVNSLSLHGGWTTINEEEKYDMPRVYISSTSSLTKTSNTVNFDISVDKRNYYPFAVPFEVAVSSVDYVNTTLASASIYGTHYVILEYDGAGRAANGAVDANWTQVASDATLTPGKGYILTAVPVAKYTGTHAAIRFPMTVDNAWTTAGELGTATISDKEVTKNVIEVTAYVKAEGETAKANKGWNLLGIPYMSCYQTGADMYTGDGAAAIMQGKIDIKTNKFDDEDEIRYVSVPTHDFSEYLQYNIVDEATKLLPGWCFFVQVEKTGNLTYAVTNQEASSDLPIYAPKREQEMPTVKTGIILSSETASDKTTILVSDKYDGTEYEINADLEKMFGNAYTLATYSLMGTTRLAYNAMSNAEARNVIPIGYRAPADGEYTFAINPRYAENFEHVNLIDYETGFVTDLLQSTYTFATERTQNDERFALNVVTRQDTATDIENGANGGNGANGVRKLIIEDKMFIIVDGRMYDAKGVIVK